MRWIALAAGIALASPAAAQDEPSVLGVDTASDADGGAVEAADAAAPGSGDAAPASDAAEAPEVASAAADGEAEGDAAEGVVETDDGAAESDDDEASEEPPSRARWTDQRAGAWAAFASSFGVAILGGVLLAVGIDDFNTIENAPGGTMWADVAGAYERAPILTGVGGVVLGLGAVGTAVSAALLAHFGSEGTWLEVSALPGGLLARGRF